MFGSYERARRQFLAEQLGTEALACVRKLSVFLDRFVSTPQSAPAAGAGQFFSGLASAAGSMLASAQERRNGLAAVKETAP